VVAHRFLKDAHRGMLIVADAPDDLLARLAAYEPPVVGKWLAGEDT
jgi:hypothetical protein